MGIPSSTESSPRRRCPSSPESSFPSQFEAWCMWSWRLSLNPRSPGSREFGTVTIMVSMVRNMVKKTMWDTPAGIPWINLEHVPFYEAMMIVLWWIFHGKTLPKSQPISKFGLRNSKGKTRWWSMFFLVFWLIFSCPKLHVINKICQNSMVVSTALSENLSDAGFLRASHVVPWFPREDGVDPKSPRRGEKHGMTVWEQWRCWEKLETFSWVFQMDIYHVCFHLHIHIHIYIYQFGIIGCDNFIIFCLWSNMGGNHFVP